VEYTDPKGRPKTVRYWRMDVLDGDFEANDEVDELRWLGLDDALECLTYDHDRDLVLMAVRHAADNQ
jgi:8-oxo-dGTP diphosphatase